MISDSMIHQVIEVLIRAAHPKKIILFGSYSRHEATEGSDLDILVIEAEVPDKRREMIRLRGLLRPLRIPVDVLVVSEQEVREWAHLPGTVLYWAIKEGKVLHDAAA